MTEDAVFFAVLAVVLVCWAVGAYNRLVRLRSAVAEQYRALHGHLLARQTLLRQSAQALAQAGLLAQPDVEDALSRAVQVLQAALEAVSRRSLGTAELEQLRQAEQALAAQLEPVWANALALPPGQARSVVARWAGELIDWQERWAFLAQPYLAAVQVYNAAVLEFPAVLVARFSGLKTLPVIEFLGLSLDDLQAARAVAAQPSPTDVLGA